MPRLKIAYPFFNPITAIVKLQKNNINIASKEITNFSLCFLFDFSVILALSTPL